MLNILKQAQINQTYSHLSKDYFLALLTLKQILQKNDNILKQIMVLESDHKKETSSKNYRDESKVQILIFFHLKIMKLFFPK